jgi:hypothetical protein
MHYTINHLQGISMPTTIYATDTYCPSTGLRLNEKPSISSAEDVSPDAASNLKAIAPESQIITGHVSECIYYKRNLKKTKREIGFQRNYKNEFEMNKDVKRVVDVTTSFWWVGLVDSNNDKHYFSVNAEGKVFSKLKKGDVMTVLFIDGITLTANIVGEKATDTVKNNRLVCACVLHKDEEQFTQIDSYYTPAKSNPIISLSFIIFAVVFLSVMFAIGGPEGTLVGGITGILSLLACVQVGSNRGDKQLEKDKQKLDELETIMKRLIKISKRDLGYHLIERPKEPNDVFCVECQSRIGAEHAFCAVCGAQQSIPEQLEPQESSVKTNVISLEQDLLSKYTFIYKGQYCHKATLFLNTKANVTMSGYMAKVIYLENEVNITDNTSVKGQQWQNHIDMFSKSTGYNRTDIEFHDTRRITRTRTSDLTAKFILQMSDGRIVEGVLPSDMVSDLEMGDWFIVAETIVDLDEPIARREFAYNLSKGKEYTADTFETYSPPIGIDRWLVLLGFALGLNFLFSAKIFDWLAPYLGGDAGLVGLIDNYKAGDYLIITAFMIISIFWLFRTAVLVGKNKRAKRELLAPLKKKIKEIRAKLPDIKQSIERLS